MEGEEKGDDGSPCSVSTLPVSKPPSIEDFVVMKPISRGAFGKVYLARKKGNSTLYAIKVNFRSCNYFARLHYCQRLPNEYLAFVNYFCCFLR